MDYEKDEKDLRILFQALTADEDSTSDSSSSDESSLSNSKCNYEENVTHFLENHQQKNTKTAIKMNGELQKMYGRLKTLIEKMLEQCKRKCKTYEELLNSFSESNGMSNAEKISSNIECSLRSYHGVGAPYFKDSLYFVAPKNIDYLTRKKQNEFFPFDINLPECRWAPHEKRIIVEGVRNQVLNYLSSKSRSRQKGIKAKNTNRNNENLQKLIEEAGNGFKINWYRISAEYLNGRHPENTCEAMWNFYAKPGILRGKFTANESNKLFEIIEKYNYQDWESIALELGKRSALQCFVNYNTELRNPNRIGNWTKKDDQLLLNVAEKFTTNKTIRWNKVLQYFPNRTKQQIYNRYICSLNPKLKKHQKFTKEEDTKIIDYVEKYGENFRNIPTLLFPGRSIIQLRNRYRHVLKFSNIKKQWTIEDDKKLLDLVERYGIKNWAQISKEIGHHTRTSCRTRYTVIEKYFKANPYMKIEEIPRKKQKKISYYEKKSKTEKRNKLHPLVNSYYEYFKLSYNYELCKNHWCLSTMNLDNFNLLKTLFGLNIQFMTMKQNTSFNEMDYKIIKLFLNESKTQIYAIRSDFVLPPSWCTLLCLRALNIQFSRSLDEEGDIKKIKLIKIDSIKNENNVHHNNSYEYLINAEKRKFRDRFFSIFYETALLSQIRLSAN